MGVQMETSFFCNAKKKRKFKVCDTKKLVLKGVVMSENLDSDENRTRYKETCLPVSTRKTEICASK